MPAGCEIRNDDNVVMLDANSPNFAVVSSGLSSTALPSYDTMHEFIATRDAGGGQYYWWKFGRPVTGASFGLQVFDENGQLTFCAATRSARIVDVFQIPNWGGAWTTRNYPSGRTYAAHIGTTTFTEVQKRGSGITEEYRILMWRARAIAGGASVQAGWDSEVFQDWTPVGTGSHLSFPAPTYQPWVVVIDVTNY